MEYTSEDFGTSLLIEELLNWWDSQDYIAWQDLLANLESCR